MTSSPMFVSSPSTDVVTFPATRARPEVRLGFRRFADWPSSGTVGDLGVVEDDHRVYTAAGWVRVDVDFTALPPPPPRTRPFTWAEYERTTRAVMVTWSLVTVRDLMNGWITIPKGTRVRITDKRGGLKITADLCDVCGVKAHMSKVHPTDLAIIETDD